MASRAGRDLRTVREIKSTEVVAPAATPAKGTDDAKGDQKPLVSDEKLETARKRWKLPDAAWKALSDEERVQWASDAAKSQSEADKMATELSKLRVKPETPKTADSAVRAQGEQPASTSTLRDLEDILAVDGEGAQKIANAISVPLLAKIKSLEDALSERDEDRELFRGALRESIERGAFHEIESEFPDLKTDPEYRKEVKALFDAQSQLDKYDQSPSLHDAAMACLRDVCKQVGYDDQKRKAERRARDLNQPNAKQLTATVKARYAGQPDHVMRYNMLGDGYTPEQIKAILDG